MPKLNTAPDNIFTCFTCNREYEGIPHNWTNNWKPEPMCSNCIYDEYSTKYPPHPYSIKNIKTFTGMEGTGFNATLYREKKRIAFLIDDASGGDVQIQWVDTVKNNSEAVALEQFIAGLPMRMFNETPLNIDPQWFVSDLVNDSINTKWLKKHCKTKTIYRLKGDSAGEFRTIKGVFTPDVKIYILRKYNEQLEEIVNERWMS